MFVTKDLPRRRKQREKTSNVEWFRLCFACYVTKIRVCLHDINVNNETCVILHIHFVRLSLEGMDSLDSEQGAKVFIIITALEESVLCKADPTSLKLQDSFNNDFISRSSFPVVSSDVARAS